MFKRRQRGISIRQQQQHPDERRQRGHGSSHSGQPSRRKNNTTLSPRRRTQDSRQEEQQGNQTEWEAYCSRLTEERVLKCGLTFVNYNKNQQERVKIETNINRFRSHYGVGHKAITAMIKDLPPQDKFVLYDLFMALSFAKNYNTEIVHASNWGVCSDKVDNRVKHYFKLMQSLKSKKIFIGTFTKNTIYAYSVDGVHSRTKESRKTPTRKVYSHKFHGPGVAYEVGMAINENRILWSKGPFKASTNDVKMFNMKDTGAFHPDMPQGKKGIADSSYSHLKEHITVHRVGHSKEMTNFINRVRARHENIYSRLKVWDVLSDVFRGSWEKHNEHKMYFEGCLVLLQYDMENGHPLMEV